MSHYAGLGIRDRRLAGLVIAAAMLLLIPAAIEERSKRELQEQEDAVGASLYTRSAQVGEEINRMVKFHIGRRSVDVDVHWLESGKYVYSRSTDRRYVYRIDRVYGYVDACEQEIEAWTDGCPSGWVVLISPNYRELMFWSRKQERKR